MNPTDDRYDPTGEEPTVHAPPMDEELVLAHKQRDEYLDQLQRSRAEFANFQKRIKAQAEQNQAYAVGNLALDLVGVLDNFERALEAARGSGAQGIVEGLDLVHRQLLSALAKHGVEPIAALGQPFDPNRHEALLKQASANHHEGTVVAELGRGYIMKDRVLRPSKVAVSVAPAS
jgi:molecular chaperone GrpE